MHRNQKLHWQNTSVLGFNNVKKIRRRRVNRDALFWGPIAGKRTPAAAAAAAADGAAERELKFVRGNCTQRPAAGSNNMQQ
jgi:hypothetical protein